MDIDEEDNYLIASPVKNILSILPKSRRCLVLVKSWLRRRSTKSVNHNIMSELKLQDCYDYPKHFHMNSETF